MLSNLTIALILFSLEIFVLAGLLFFFHARVHHWFVAARRRYHHTPSSTDPDLLDVKQIAENLVEARQAVQAALEKPAPPAIKSALQAELEQISHFTRILVSNQTLDGEACRLALASVRDLVDLAAGSASKAVAPAALPTEEPLTIEAKLAALQNLAAAGEPVVMKGPTTTEPILSTDEAINRLADQLLAAGK